MDNVIKAYFYSGNIARTNTVFQYNRGMILKFMDVDLPATYRVDFANSLTGQSVTCVGTADGVIVPLEVMAKGCTVYAWAVIANEDSTVTEYQAMIPISPRAEPTDEAPNPEQQQVIDQLIAAMNLAVEQTGEDVESADAAAAAAAASAQAAAASEAAAAASEQAAAASEQAAAGSASSASDDAATAASAASTATQQAGIATSGAGTATQKAADAAASAQAAAASETAAAGSASSASDDAATAASAANTATQQAGIATSGAGTATQKAADAAASAQDAAASETASAGSAAAAATSETNAGAAETAAQTAQAAAEAAAQSVGESAAQIETNKEDIADLKSALETDYFRLGHGKNYINPNDLIKNKRLYAENVGSQQRYTDYNDADIIKIAIDPETNYTAIGVRSHAFVTANNTVISAFYTHTVTESFTVESPANASHVWLQIFHTELSYAQLQAGTESTGYEPYSETAEVNGVTKFNLPLYNSEYEIIKNIYGEKYYANSAADFPNLYAFLSDGTKTTSAGNSRPSTSYIDITDYGFTSIKYGLCQLKDTTKTLNVISFFDEDYVYISGVTSVGQGYVEGQTYVPTGAKYVVGTWYTSLTETPYIVGYTGEAINPRLEALEAKDPKQTVTEIVNSGMSLGEFISAVNAGFDDYAVSCRCKRYCFLDLSVSMNWNTIYNVLNMNFRGNVCDPAYTFEENCYNINVAFTKPIYRFVDARLNNTTGLQFSLNTNFQADEPSAVVSEDGGKLIIYAHLKRIDTEDGVKWSQPTNLVLTGGGAITYLMHVNVNLIDGVYYLIGPNSNEGGDMHLFTSTDGINFAYAGKLFDSNYEPTPNYNLKAWGNTYLHKDYGSGKYYFYIESQAVGEPWRIDLMTCDDILHDNGDGTIGDWVASQNNPMIYKPIYAYNQQYQTAGNPDFFKGPDNRPIKVNNKYFMMFHNTWPNRANLMRASSSTLDSWDVDGFMLDNRDTPTGGDTTSGNADACVIQFRDRTYLFYTWDINNPQVVPYIKYMIDDRPLHVLLGLRP